LMGWAWLYPLALCLSVMVFSVLVPRIAVQLAVVGHSGVEIGLFSMITFLVVFISTPVMPRLYRRFGINRAYMLGLVCNLIAVSGFTSFKRYDLLCATAVFSGISACCVWGATETLIARNAPAKRLGTITGLYQTMLGSVLAIGPFLPGLLHLSPLEVKWLVLASLGLAFLLVFVAAGLNVKADLGSVSSGAPISWLKTLLDMPVLLLAAFVGGVFEAGIGNVGSVQTIGFGVSQEQAVFFAGAIAFGSLAMQWPIGMLADRMSYQTLLRISLLILIASASVAWVGWQSLTLWWLSALIWGGVGGALYTLAMISVGHQFRGAHTARYASASIAAYTLGCMVGPFMIGAAFDFDPRRGVSALLFAIALVAFLALELKLRLLPCAARLP
jgi:MFS family permease